MRLRLRLSTRVFHIYFGHVDYLKFKTGFHVLSELHPEVTALSNIDRHTLERDADRNAAWNVLAGVIGDYRGEYGVPVHQQNPDARSEGLRRYRIFGALVAMYSVFRIFNDRSLRDSEEEILNSTHPPTTMRISMALMDVGRDLVANGTLTEGLLFQIGSDAIKHSEEAFLFLLGNRVVRPDDPRETGAKQLSILQKYQENWKVLRPQLDKFKRGGSLVDG